MIQIINRFRKSHRGQSLVEMALILPILIIILFGIMEFGRVFHAYLVITHAAREGARYGVIAKDVAEIKQKVQDTSPGIELDLANDVSVNPATEFPTGFPLTVRVNYDAELYIPFLNNILPNPIPLTAESTMQIE